MRQSVIVAGARTPFGKFGGMLRGASAVELGAAAIRGALKRSSLEAADVGHVIMGMALQGGAGQNPARQAARHAGLDWKVTAETVNKVCASGFRSVTMADQIIRSGDVEVLVAGGMESMTNAPYLLPGARWGTRMGHQSAVDMVLHDGLECAFHQVHMIVHGSRVAAEFNIGRDAQDEWAHRSHSRAVLAMSRGYFAEEIVPVMSIGRNGTLIADQDEAPRQDASMEALAALAPLHDKNGTITAGNAPGVNDGAAAMAVMSAEKAAASGIKPLAAIVGHASVGLEARYIATAPAVAIRKLLQLTSLKPEDIARFEINEAFAAVVLTCKDILGLEPDKINVNGGAVALGHPIGASGARIILTLVHELRRSGGGFGIAAICSGTAQGDAILVRVDS